MDDNNFFDKETLKAISSDTRSDILNLLHHKNYTLSDISEKLKLSNSTIKEHLDVLSKTGLIQREETNRKWKYYSLTSKGKYFCTKYKAREEEKSVLAIEENYMKRNVLVGVIALILVAGILFTFVGFRNNTLVNSTNHPVYTLNTFSSDKELINAFKNVTNNYSRNSYGGMLDGGMMKEAVATSAGAPQAVNDSAAGSSNSDYSTTNIQVAGVDEADIIKTDGQYIYAIANGKFYVIDAYPGTEAKILSTLVIKDVNMTFNASELFIDGDKVLIFGNSNYNDVYSETTKYSAEGRDIGMSTDYMPRYNMSGVTIKLIDVSDKTNPEVIKTVDFEGSYLTSRKIGDYVYFVVNSYGHYNETGNQNCSDIVPLYREVNGTTSTTEMKPIAACTDIGYVMPIQAGGFTTIASISMTNINKEIEKQVIVGSGNEVYASLDNIYLTQATWPTYGPVGGLVNSQDNTVKTTITKFNLDNGKINFVATNSVKGTLLNQYSMDEYNGDFRLATTISGYTDNKDTSTNNVYVLDDQLTQVGSIEGIAPSEKIYSVRFMGDRGYMVTFRHVDPLYVIDLSEPTNPKILGQLKIPGYSDYLHPYDATHIIGIGKDVDASIDADKIHTEGAVYYTAIQGVKISIFDVSDVSNPIEMYKVVIGDRGTESLATSDPKAFLFDKEKNLLVVPMTVAELSPGQSKSDQGQYVFDGAYVYNISLENGFNLIGKITHDSNSDSLAKSGYYYYGGDTSIKRSLYIKDILYTFSNSMLKLNKLDSTLDEINSLVLNN